VLPIGRISIPKIGLDHEIYEGIWLTVIDVGPGHWPGTPLPGGYGNAVFAGHRVTHSHPFRDVDLLTNGDVIVFTLRDGAVATYRVTEQFVVDPEALWITDQAAGSTLTLFACHPKGSARQRIVIRGELVEGPSESG
jgi:sortase A